MTHPALDDLKKLHILWVQDVVGVTSSSPVEIS